jgi:hypothetical protein
LLARLRECAAAQGREDASTVQIGCAILRRIEITESLLARLSKGRLIGQFFAAAIEAGEELRALAILRQFADVGPFPEMVTLCDFVLAKLEGRDEELAKAAVAATSAMCISEQCVERFRQEEKLAEIFAKRDRTKPSFRTFLGLLA